jgi:hypothetical protein
VCACTGAEVDDADILNIDYDNTETISRLYNQQSSIRRITFSERRIVELTKSCPSGYFWPKKYHLGIFQEVLPEVNI